MFFFKNKIVMNCRVFHWKFFLSDAQFLTARHYSNSQNSIILFDYSWFLVKNLSNSLSLAWKLYNQYCHSFGKKMDDGQNLKILKFRLKYSRVLIKRATIIYFQHFSHCLVWHSTFRMTLNVDYISTLEEKKFGPIWKIHFKCSLV